MKNIVLLIVSVLIVFSGCKKMQANEEQKNNENESVVVGTIKPEVQSFSPVLSFSGTVYPNKEANLGATFPGKVEKIYFEEGANVKEDNILVELSGELLIQAQIENNALKKDFERLQRLKEKGSVSEMEYDHLKAQFEASVSKVNMMKKNTEIRAPFSGTIVQYMVHEGENFSFIPSIDKNMKVASGIVRLIQTNIVKVKIEVNEKDLVSIKKGQQTKISVDAYPTETFTGTIVLINPEFSAISRTTTVEIEVPNSKNLLKPGMYANIIVELPAQKGLTIPLMAVFRQQGTADDYVFVIRNGVANRTKVQKLQTQNDNVVIAGITADDEIVVTGKGKLMEGMKVEVR